MQSIKRNLVPLMLLMFVLITNVPAQQSVKTVPTLTTEGVAGRVAGERSYSDRPLSAQNQQTAAEIDWNERYQLALARLKRLERQADQAELGSVQTRNEIYARAHQPQELNQLNNRISQLVVHARNLRAEAEGVRAELGDLLDEARVNGYKFRSFALFRASGEPDPQSFRERFMELQQDLLDAQARAAVMQLRVNRAGTNLRSIGCARFDQAGRCVAPNDIFYEKRVRADLQSARADLETALARVLSLRQQLADLQQQGERAGLPPGLFR